MSKIKAWSYSVYSTYKKCPKQLYYKKIEKIPEPKSPAMERGNELHKKAELYLTKEGRAVVPKELKKIEHSLKFVRSNKLVFAVEQNWAFTKNFANQTEWRNWSGAWCRAKIDLVAHDPEVEKGYVVVDHKTGKVYEQDHAEQLELSALATFLWIPEAQHVVAENWYIDQGEDYTTPYEFERKEVPALKKKWIAKVKPLLNDTTFSERPGMHCNWCPFSKKKGGPCKFGG